MKDVTSTSFGLLMAYLLPGLVGLYSIGFWSDSVRDMFRTFLAAQWQVGLFLLLLAAALITGLLVGALRWVLVDTIAKDKQLAPESFKKLANDTRFSAFCYVVDENFRYHQFWGGMVLVMPLFFCGLLRQSWGVLSCWTASLLLSAFLSAEVITGIASWRAYMRFIRRAKCILEGE